MREGGPAASASGGVHPDDSLLLAPLDRAVDLALLEEEGSSFWRRIIPRVRLSASLGTSEWLFPDPSSALPWTPVRDAYGISAVLSLEDVLDFDRHTTAVLRRRRLEAQREAASRALRLHREIRHAETALAEDLLRYTGMLFRQGEAPYEALIGARLRLLRLKEPDPTRDIPREEGP